MTTLLSELTTFKGWTLFVSALALTMLTFVAAVGITTLATEATTYEAAQAQHDARQLAGEAAQVPAKLSHLTHAIGEMALHLLSPDVPEAERTTAPVLVDGKRPKTWPPLWAITPDATRRRARSRRKADRVDAATPYLLAVVALVPAVGWLASYLSDVTGGLIACGLFLAVGMGLVILYVEFGYREEDERADD